MVASPAAMCAHWQRCAFCDAEESCDHQLLAQKRAVKRSPTVGASRRTLQAWHLLTRFLFLVFFSFFLCETLCIQFLHPYPDFSSARIASKWTHLYIVPRIFKFDCGECTILYFGQCNIASWVISQSHTSGFHMCGILGKYYSCSQDSSNLSLGIAPS